jgi:hypothetical protein
MKKPKKRESKKERELREKREKKKKRKKTLNTVMNCVFVFCLVFTLTHLLLYGVAYKHYIDDKKAETQTLQTSVTTWTIRMGPPIIDSSAYSYNETYKGTIIYATNETWGKEIEHYFSLIKKDLDDQNITIPVIAFNDDNSCQGEISGYDNSIEMSSCEGKQVRNVYLNSSNWLPYVLYHEIGHATTERGNQCIADAYAQKMIKRTDIKINITDKNCIQEGMTALLPNETDNTTYRVGQERDGSVEVEVMKVK